MVNLKIEERLSKIEERLSIIEERLFIIEERFSKFEERLSIMEERFSKIETLLLSQKTVLNLNEVSEFTGLSRSHLYKLTSQGKIPHYKPNGKYIFFDRIEIEKWLLRNRVKIEDEIESEAATYGILKN